MQDDKLNKLEKEIEKLKEEVKYLRERRIHQTMVLPDAIKTRHIGEGVRFVRAGLAANRPDDGERDGAIYFATDSGLLYIYSIELSGWAIYS